MGNEREVEMRGKRKGRKEGRKEGGKERRWGDRGTEGG